jgi:hypothetical protein
VFGRYQIVRVILSTQDWGVDFDGMQRPRLGTLVKGSLWPPLRGATLDKGAEARKRASMRNDAGPDTHRRPPDRLRTFSQGRYLGGSIGMFQISWSCSQIRGGASPSLVRRSSPNEEC